MNAEDRAELLAELLAERWGAVAELERERSGMSVVSRRPAGRSAGAARLNASVAGELGDVLRRVPGLASDLRQRHLVAADLFDEQRDQRLATLLDQLNGARVGAGSGHVLGRHLSGHEASFADQQVAIHVGIVDELCLAV